MRHVVVYWKHHKSIGSEMSLQSREHTHDEIHRSGNQVLVDTVAGSDRQLSQVRLGRLCADDDLLLDTP